MALGRLWLGTAGRPPLWTLAWVLRAPGSGGLGRPGGAARTARPWKATATQPGRGLGQARADERPEASLVQGPAPAPSTVLGGLWKLKLWSVVVVGYRCNQAWLWVVYHYH